MEDWDDIDWDKKVEDIVKKQQKSEEVPAVNQSQVFQFRGQEDGNYFEANQEKERKQQEKRNKNKAGSSKKSSTTEEYIQPYSFKELKRIRDLLQSSTTLHSVIFETFGQFEKFLQTHEENLTNDALVELLIIDTALLEIPFQSHNQLLLRGISRIESFWSQLISFLEEFLLVKHQDMKFLLTVDMHKFFDNIESLLHNLIVRNLFSEQMEKVFEEIVNVMEKFAGNQWSCGGRLRSIQESYGRNRDVHKIYDVS
jgi:hypothetical protein